MEKVLLLRQGELFLKGQNQRSFEKLLQRNISLQTGFSSRHLRGRIILPFFSEHSKIGKIFGITSYSPAFCVEKKEEHIFAAAQLLLAEASGTFKVQTNRADKRFPLTSLQMNVLLGKQLEQQGKLIYAKENPQHLLHVEINQDGAYLFTETFPCNGGLPVGMEGKVLLLVEDEASILAGILMMKRGCSLVPVIFAGSNQNKDEKTWLSLLLLLQEYSPLPLSPRSVCSEKDIEELAQKEGALALAKGETFSTRWERKFSLPLFKPLMSYSEEEVEEALRRWGVGCSK